MTKVMTYRNPMTSLMNQMYHCAKEQDAKEQRLNIRVDITEDAKGYYLYADLPGLQKSDLTIQVEKEVITISGERASNRDSNDEEQYRYFERRFGAFERSFKLPESVQKEQIEASMKNGVLSITMPKSEEALPQTIEIAVD